MVWAHFIFGLLLLTTISYSQEIASENSNEVRRHFARPGQIIELDPEDKKVVEMAEYSLKKYAQKVGLKYKEFDVTVFEATEQLTTGTTYKLHFYAKPIVYYSENPSNCNRMNLVYILNCHSQINSRPWQHKTDVNVDCQKEYPIGEN